jgi:hypothetical protein
LPIRSAGDASNVLIYKRNVMIEIAAKAPGSPAGGAESPTPPLRAAVGQYGAAVAAIAVALGARVLMAPILHDEAPYLFFVPAVLIAAGVGGFLPGLLAIEGPRRSCRPQAT